MTPHAIIALADSVRRFLPTADQPRIRIAVTRKEWDDLAEVITHLRPITKHPDTKPDPPREIHLLGIKVIVE